MLILHPPTGITILAMARHAAKIAKHRATLPDRYLHQHGWLRYDIDHPEALAIRVDAPSPDDLRFRAGVFGEAREGPGLLGFTMAGVPVTCISADGGIAKIAADMVAQHTALIDTTHSGLVFVGEHAWTKALAHTRETRSVAGGGPETLEFDVVLAAAGEDPFDAPASKLARLMMAPSGPVSIREQGEWVTSLHGPHFAWTLESMTTTRTDDPGHVRATLTFKSSSTARELTPEEVESFLPAGASDDAHAQHLASFIPPFTDTCDTRQMIERAVLAVPGVREARVSGHRDHHIMAFVEGGDDQAVAAAIFDNAPQFTVTLGERVILVEAPGYPGRWRKVQFTRLVRYGAEPTPERDHIDMGHQAIELMFARTLAWLKTTGGEA